MHRTTHTTNQNTARQSCDDNTDRQCTNSSTARTAQISDGLGVNVQQLNVVARQKHYRVLVENVQICSALAVITERMTELKTN